MPRIIRLSIFLIGTIILFTLLFSPVSAGVGASPSILSFSSMLRGGYAERYVTVSNPGDAVSVSISADGDTAKWLNITPSSFNLSAHAFQVISVKVNPTSDVPNGNYKGSIVIMGAPASAAAAGGTGAIAISGVSIPVYLEISDVEHWGYTVESVSVPDTEECRPIQLIASVRNTGNVREKADFNINIANGASILKTYNWTSEEMLPTKVYSFVVRVPYELEQFRCIPIGSYVANLKAYLNNNLMHTQSLPFKIHERGSLSLSGVIAKLTVPENITLGESARIDAVFQNTGQMPVLTKLKAEIWRGTRLVKTVESDEFDVNIGTTQTLTAYYTPNLPGDYKVKAFALFEGKSSEPVEAMLKVIMPVYMMIGIALLVVLAVWAIMRLLKKRRPRSERYAVAP